MGQAIATRVEVLGILHCLGPVHVGGWDNTAEANLTVARDGTGRPYLPGTSIAGALRAYLNDLDRFRGGGGHLPPTEALFGQDTNDDRGGSPSWVRVDDAPLVGQEVTPVVRDGVGIDRRSGSAAANFLYARQVLPAGTTFALRLVVDTPTATATPDHPGGWPALVRDAVEAMVAGLSHGRVPIGAGRGRGLGRVALSDVTVRRADLSDPAGLSAWLTGNAPAVPLGPDGGEPPADGRLRVTVQWRPTSPLLVRDSVSGTVVDTLPLTDTAADGTVRLLLPGSSLRGAVRAYAEKVVRSLRCEDAPDDFGEGLRNPPPVVDVLFGSSPTGGGPGADRRRDTDGADTPAEARPGWRGVLTVADCRSVGAVNLPQWEGVVTTTPAPVPADDREEREHRAELNQERDAARSTLRQRLDGIGDAFALRVSDHVAIDRWTGGAADHRLFSVLDPETTVAWEPIRLDVDTARLHRYPRGASAPAALALLLLVLRDLRDGWLNLGYGVTRGHGQLQVTGVRFDGAGLPEPWSALAGRTLDRVLADPPPAVTEAMTAWHDMFQQEAA